MKIKEARAVLEEKSLDFAFFYNLDSSRTSPNMAYFSGYDGLGALIIPKKKEAFLIAPKMELERAKRGYIKNVYPIDKKKFFESLRGILAKKKIKAKKIAIDGQNFSLNFYRNMKKELKTKAKDISLECLKLRSVKTEKEIKIIKKGFNHADKILEKAIKSIRSLKTETNVAAFLEYEAKKLGLGTSFEPIVASGKNASMPHHKPENTKLNKGFCVIDFGVKYRGYCTDCTRTIYIGKPDNKEKDIYNFLLGIQKNIVNNIKINDNCGKIYEKCVKELKEYSKYFIHGLGHGVGVEIHEMPNLSLGSKDKIMKNMAFTVEPGIYIPKKLGIRIEDTILMKTKPELLTKVSKDLLII